MFHCAGAIAVLHMVITLWVVIYVWSHQVVDCPHGVNYKSDLLERLKHLNKLTNISILLNYIIAFLYTVPISLGH